MFTGLTKKEILELIIYGVVGCGIFFGLYWLLWFAFSIFGGV